MNSKKRSKKSGWLNMSYSILPILLFFFFVRFSFFYTSILIGCSPYFFEPLFSKGNGIDGFATSAIISSDSNFPPKTGASIFFYATDPLKTIIPIAGCPIAQNPQRHPPMSSKPQPPT